MTTPGVADGSSSRASSMIVPDRYAYSRTGLYNVDKFHGTGSATRRGRQLRCRRRAAATYACRDVLTDLRRPPGKIDADARHARNRGQVLLRLRPPSGCRAVDDLRLIRSKVARTTSAGPTPMSSTRPCASSSPRESRASVGRARSGCPRGRRAGSASRPVRGRSRCGTRARRSEAGRPPP